MTDIVIDVDANVLIKLVEQTPVLWDKSIENRTKTSSSLAWQEICTVLNPDYENLPQQQKLDYEIRISKRWKNMRDMYIKSLKNPRRQSNYCYHDQFKFLDKNFDIIKEKSITKNSSAEWGESNRRLSLRGHPNTSSKRKLEKNEKDTETTLLSMSKKKRSLDNPKAPLTPSPETTNNSAMTTESPVAPFTPTEASTGDTPVTKTKSPDIQIKDSPSFLESFIQKPTPFLAETINAMPNLEIPVSASTPAVATTCITNSAIHGNNRHLAFMSSLLPSLADFTENETLQFHSQVITMVLEMRKSRTMAEN